MGYTRKDYVNLAESIRTAFADTNCADDLRKFNAPAVGALHECVADNIAGNLGEGNPGFDRKRFLKDAGVSS